jgi:hypothetical protein
MQPAPAEQQVFGDGGGIARPFREIDTRRQLRHFIVPVLAPYTAKS